MKKYAGIVALLVLVTALPVFTVQASKHEDHKCSMTPLDAETKVKLKKLTLQYKLEMVDLEAEKAKIHEAVMAEFMKDDYSTKDIEKLAKDMDSLKAKMHKVKMSYMFKARKLMTADQFMGFVQKMSKEGGCKCDCCGSGKCSCGGKGCTHGARGKAGCSSRKMGAACGSRARAGCEETCKIKVKK